MSAPAPNNYLAALAERTGGEYRADQGKSAEAAACYLATARLIAEARESCRGTCGAWGTWLDRAGIPETTSRLLVRIVHAGLSAETLAEHGIRAAAKALAKPNSATVAGFEAPAESPELPAKGERVGEPIDAAGGLSADFDALATKERAERRSLAQENGLAGSEDLVPCARAALRGRTLACAPPSSRESRRRPRVATHC